MDQKHPAGEKSGHAIVSYLLTFLFLGGIILTVFEIHIYRNTLVSGEIVTTVWLVCGVLMTPVTAGLLERYYGTKNIFLKLVYNAGAFGGIVVYCFMALNYYFPNDPATVVQTEIIAKGTLAKRKHRCGKPYASVRVRHTTKQLVFSCGFNLERYRYINLTLKRGLLGIDVIVHREPVEEW